VAVRLRPVLPNEESQVVDTAPVIDVESEVCALSSRAAPSVLPTPPTVPSVSSSTAASLSLLWYLTRSKWQPCEPAD
jgi:hypothetical protein